MTGCGGDGEAPGDQGGPPGASAERGGRPGGNGESGGGRPGGGRPRGGGPPGGFGGPGGFGAPQDDRGVPVEVVAVARRPIASYLETHGTLEAENEVDLVARTTGPIVALNAEEGQTVPKGQVLARIDDREIRAQLEIAKVELEETKLAYERTKKLHGEELISQQTLDQALANYQSAQSDHERIRVQLLYTEIAAPFSGLVVRRYVRFAQHVANGDELFRLSDFDPLLAPIQVPERELPRLRPDQPAWLEVEAWPGERFDAKVLRISPVVDAATGTVRVTLEVDGQGKLRPGMFASVHLELESRPEALVVPKAALALDSLGDTVFVAADGVAERRAIELGFRSDDLLEVTSGLREGERVVVVGQDGLSDGTPIEILGGAAGLASSSGERTAGGGPEAAGPPGRRPAEGRPGTGPAGVGAPGEERSAAGDPPGRPGGGSAMERSGGGPGGPGRGPGGGGRGFWIDFDDPAAVERAREFMRSRGLSDEQVEEWLERKRARQEGG